MPSEVGMDNEYKKKQKVLQQKVKKVGTKNPVVKEAVKRLDPKRDTYEDFEPVHELVSAAYAMYTDGGNLEKCLLDLGRAITKLGEST